MRLLLLAFALTFTSISPNIYAGTISASDLAKHYTYQDADLSPDGTKLAINVVQGGVGRLIILDLTTFKTVGTILFEDRYEPGDSWWVNNDRLVIKVVQNELTREQPAYYGELFSTNYDGSDGLMIYGYRAGGRKTGTRMNRKKSTRGWAEFLDVLPSDDKHVLISSTLMTDDGSALPTVHKLNVYNGKMSNVITKSPIPQAEFMTDKTGEVRLLIGAGSDGFAAVYQRDLSSNKWTQLSNDVFGDSFYPLALDEKGTGLYALDEGDNDKLGLYKFDLEKQTLAHIFTDKVVDITNVTFSTDGRTPYALRLDDGLPDYVMFGAKNVEAELYKQFLQSFPGNAVTLLSSSIDGKKLIVYVHSDISPGTYYLFDRTKNQLQFLFNNLDHIPSELMSQSRAISFNSSDNTLIHGYLSYPVSQKADTKAPLVVLVHGGPHGVRDYWLFDRDVQFLTAQGYAVLRVNFRGSDGYGDSYHFAGYKRWGDRIQQDIIDGTSWALGQKGIDSNKACIMGASFGAYSAVMSATKAPDLFKCVIANAGMYDLSLMYEEGDIPERLYGKEILKEYIGDDMAALKAFSPINFIEKINAPILIGHGKKDRRTPYIHAETLKDELKRKGKSYVWFVRGTESHGFFDEENRTEWYEAVEAFLTENL